MSAETGCGGLHKNIIADVRPEPRLGKQRKLRRLGSSPVSDISLTRREICQNAAASDTLVPFQNVMAGGNMTP